ncbi:hypothetical protein B0H19DRAFT_1297041 [Mycena capillaripes]|nr:hypothetical protein B0H19DRAFT_1297041 [Mycena capillaripes]
MNTGSLTTYPISIQVFKFSDETNTICVENIPQNVNRLEVFAFFSTLIADIHVSQASDEALEISIYTVDSSWKALCMARYNVAGSALLLMSPFAPSYHPLFVHPPFLNLLPSPLSPLSSASLLPLTLRLILLHPAADFCGCNVGSQVLNGVWYGHAKCPWQGPGLLHQQFYAVLPDCRCWTWTSLTVSLGNWTHKTELDG